MVFPLVEGVDLVLFALGSAYVLYQRDTLLRLHSMSGISWCCCMHGVGYMILKPFYSLYVLAFCFATVVVT